MQRHKSIKIFSNYVLGPVLFGWLSWAIYREIQNQDGLQASWLHIKDAFQSYQVVYFLSAVLLIGVNWGLEARKWQVSLRSLPVSFTQAFKAVLTGVSFSAATPNRAGEYVGRMLHLPEGSRLQSLPLTLVSSISQLLVTFYAGLAGLLFLKQPLLAAGLGSEPAYRLALLGVGATALFLTLLYFETETIGRWLHRWLGNSWFGPLVQALPSCGVQLLLHLLLLSFFRYFVFVAQYILLFRFFGVFIPVGLAWHVLSLLFLALAIIPTISLAEAGVRGKLSLMLVGLFAVNHLGIGLTAVTIWFLNLVLPAAVGSVLIFGVKFIYQRNEEI